MTRLYIVRHGETLWNADSRIQGHTDIELTENGIQQAKLVARRLSSEKIDAIYSSDLKRAFVTGESINEFHGLTINSTELLREAFLGDWQGLTMAEVAEKYQKEHSDYLKDSIANRPPNAEKLEEVIARCNKFLSDLLANHAGQNIAVTTHGGAIRGILAAAFEMGPELYRRVRLDNGGLTIIDFDRNNNPLLVALNDTCHLFKAGIGDGADE